MFDTLSYKLDAETLKKAAGARDCFVKTPTLNGLVQEIAHFHGSVHGLRASTRPGGHATCRLIYGLPGSGKTTAVRFYESQFPRIEEEERTRIPVLYVETPPEATLRATALETMKALDPMGEGWERRTQAELTSKIAEFAEKCDLQLLIIDEAQDIGRRGAGGKPEATAVWLQRLLNLKRFNILLVGVPEAYPMFTSTMPLLRRSGGVIPVRPYVWTNEDDQKVFRMIVNEIENAMGLPERSNLASERLALRLYNFSGGLIGVVVRILEAANDKAWATGMRKVTVDLLARMADGMRPANQDRWVNPFRVRDLEPTEPGHAAIELDFLGRGRR